MKNILYIFLCIIISCNQKQEPKEEKPDISKIKKPLEYANRQLIKEEEQEINSFISRYGWKMNKTATGLRYYIYKKGSGKKTEEGSVVKVKYDLSLINGTKIYNGVKEIKIGRSKAEHGLEEGLLLMRVGDKAKLILPSHLGYGLHGDENLIPKRATLVYDIEVLEVIN